MASKKTIVDHVDILPSGVLMVRMKKLVINGDQVAIQYHRTSIEPDQDLDAHMQHVSDSLVAAGEGPIEDFGAVKQHAAIFHTPGNVTAYKAAKKDAEERAERARLEAEARARGKP